MTKAFYLPTQTLLALAVIISLGLQLFDHHAVERMPLHGHSRSGPYDMSDEPIRAHHHIYEYSHSYSPKGPAPSITSEGQDAMVSYHAAPAYHDSLWSNFPKVCGGDCVRYFFAPTGLTFLQVDHPLTFTSFYPSHPEEPPRAS